jgi:H+-transporting ATPase
LGTNIIQADAILKKTDEEAVKIIEEADGFAEVYPEHKYHIVELLQNKGHIVGMTGDGVNDAPALKKANAGIAVAGATDAAKSAASIVLTKPGLSVIIDAIKTSRKIFERMTNYSIYRISETVRVLLFMTLSILIYNFYPITALMIVLLALFNDFPIMTIASDNVYVSEKPTKWDFKRLVTIATGLGLIGVIHSFFVLFLGKNWTWLGENYNQLLDPNSTLHSFIYLKLSLAGQLTILVARTKSHFWSVKPSKPLLYAIIGTQLIVFSIVLTGIIPGLPQLPIHTVIFLIFEVFAFLFIPDYAKVYLYKWLERKKA